MEADIEAPFMVAAASDNVFVRTVRRGGSATG